MNNALMFGPVPLGHQVKPSLNSTRDNHVGNHEDLDVNPIFSRTPLRSPRTLAHNVARPLDGPHPQGVTCRSPTIYEVRACVLQVEEGERESESEKSGYRMSRHAGCDLQRSPVSGQDERGGHSTIPGGILPSQASFPCHYRSPLISHIKA